MGLVLQMVQYLTLSRSQEVPFYTHSLRNALFVILFSSSAEGTLKITLRAF